MYEEDILQKYELKEEGLRLEEKNLDQAIVFYNDLITNEFFFDDYYPFKRLTVLYHKKKDYLSEAEIIVDFFKSNIPCNKYQFYSFKYKLMRNLAITTYGYYDILDLFDNFLENTFRADYADDLKNIPAERIIKKYSRIEQISEEEMIKRYKKGFLEFIANGLYKENENIEAFDIYVKMIYEYNYVSFRYYQRLCSIYRRTKNYKHELMVIREYFEEKSIKKSKHNKIWFKDRLETTKDLINDDKIVDSILNSKYEKAAFLKSEFELINWDLDENLEDKLGLDLVEKSDNSVALNSDIHFDDKSGSDLLEKSDNGMDFTMDDDLEDKKGLDLDENLDSAIAFNPNEQIEKADDFILVESLTEYSEKDLEEKCELKNNALTLEKEDINAAIKLYKELITNRLFAYDYYPYRRLTILYDKIKDYKSQYNIIKYFLESGIYCNNHQFLWFRNKLRRLREKGIIKEENISELEDIFNEKGINNKQLSYYPVVIADRIRLKKGKIYIIPEEKYDATEKRWELEEIANEYNRQKEYDKAIEIYEDMIHSLNYRSYRYFDKLCILYHKTHRYDKEFNIIKEYYNGKSTHTAHSDNLFASHLMRLKKILNLSDEEVYSMMNLNDGSIDEKSLNLNESSEDNSSLLMEELNESESISNSNEVKTKEKPMTLAKCLGVMNEYSHILSIMKEYDIDLEKPVNIYSYDDSLSEIENINRKFYLKEVAKALDSFKLYDDLVNLYKIYTKNDYFENDWYPYRQLCITYKKTKDYSAYLNNIKDLFLSDIYLNDYQYTWFTNKIKLLRDHIEIDEDQVRSWLDYYKLNGAKNKDKLNCPTVLADRMKLDDNKIFVLSEDAFNLTQEIYYLIETGRILEKGKNYEMAISFYKDQIKSYPIAQFYKRICICSEELKDYEEEYDCINHYFANPPKNASPKYDVWFLKKQKKVNSKLNKIYGDEYSQKDLGIKIENKSLNSNYEGSFKDVSESSDSNESFEEGSESSDLEDIKDDKLIADDSSGADFNNDIANLDDDEYIKDLFEPILEKFHSDSNKTYEEKLKDSLNKNTLAEKIGLENEFSYKTPIMSKYEVDLEKECEFYEYDESLSLDENINRKYYLINYGQSLYKLRKYKKALVFYKKLRGNSYFKNDWLPYKQISRIYTHKKDYESNLENIKDVYLSAVYLNGYQEKWFEHNLKDIGENITVYKTRLTSWLNFYYKHGKNNIGYLNKPVVLADRFEIKDDLICIYSEDAFNISQKLDELEETGKILEKTDIESAVSFYEDTLEKYPFAIFYKRICICLEELEDYEKELKYVEYYFNNSPIDLSESTDNWFMDSRKRVNIKLSKK